MPDKFTRLDEISDAYDSEVDFDRNLIEFNFDIIKDNLNLPRVLELGCASGVMTRLLLTKVKSLDVVDGSQKYIDQLKPELGDRVSFQLALFEDYQTDLHYNDIIMARALEHIEDPVGLLKKIATWLDPEKPSSIHIVVPNANSLHRKVGVAMKMIPEVTSLSERDYKYGHKRVYTRQLLEQHVKDAGLRVEYVTGIFLKPLSNAQMQSWPPELIQAFFRVGIDFPEYSDSCAELYLKCTNTG